PNCDTVRKARRWLDEHGIEYRFHDYRKQGVDPEQIATWMDRLGWTQVINRRGMTWRRLPEALREGMDQTSALGAACESPSLIRRPIVESGDRLLVGFDPDAWSEALS
ncbi:MAG: arsenate reductase, partial [Halothiobacillaceae bacterium]